ncbi:RNA polymerase sigma factor [Haliangium ochraceum]|uniref:RNA polymerase, sigma-24 subunit, ECF subfamily n=1 Tax=Haliangium ochraceum (strain DSM 14365 / JCM 11303 / SMP-2) TaxID=502025 RepID=D0LM80_HALO1|nr:RNA polymerase sigma factor [Haliangium ochraceum]ACY16786.1 RNA polymerase, sigma-24 subunit, ECF subfamily [Haliangium ochraceum DSM 14365]
MRHVSDSDRERLLTLLEPVYERAHMSARRLCRSQADGDDLYQEALLRALTRIQGLRDEQAFPAWFYRILLSVHRSRQRRRFWRLLLPLDDERPAAREPVGEDGGRWEEQRQGARRVREALAVLPAVQREAVVLFDIDGYSIAEVAEMQRASPSAVKSRLSRARARLRSHYQRLGIGAPAPMQAQAQAPEPQRDERALAVRRTS